MIYLDNAATTKPKKEVIDAMMPYFTDMWYNPSSLYKPSVDVKKKVEEARNTIAKFIGANSNEIFFTSGGSESNCWAIQGFVNECKYYGQDCMVITSVIEHKSIIDCTKNINVEVSYINVDSNGFIEINKLKEVLEYAKNIYNKILVSIQYANNEIGTRQQIEEIAKLVHEYNGVFHTDAVQAFGQLPIDVNKSGIDMLSASGHKIGTPKGVGILYKKTGVNIKPLIYGSQMDRMRGGTENVPYIVGMAKAVELLDNSELDLFGRFMRVSCRRNYFMNMLKKKFGCTINGTVYCRLPNNINVTFPQNITGEALIYMLDMCGIYISSGSACNAHSVEPSHVLKAIGLSNEEASRTVRISLSDDITEKQINNVICEMEKQIKLLEME